MTTWGGFGAGGWRSYVPVAERRRRAARKIASMKKAGRDVSPIEITGRTIAKTFWGEAWCRNLEAYSDYANRLPRGRTYVRNGSVLDLRIEAGRVAALVSGSEIYTVSIAIASLKKKRWKEIKGRCAGQIDSLVELLQGSVSKGVMEIVTRKGEGLFPSPREITLDCSCPDWAAMCKHVAATLYGVGARLDERPELLFALRGVDPAEMVEAAVDHGLQRRKPGRAPVLAADDLSSVFGVEIDTGGASPEEGSAGAGAGMRTRTRTRTKTATRSATRKAADAKGSARRSLSRKKRAAKKTKGKKTTGNKAARKKRAGKKTGTQAAGRKTRATAVSARSTKKSTTAKAGPKKSTARKGSTKKAGSKRRPLRGE